MTAGDHTIAIPRHTGPPTAWGMAALFGGPIAWSVHIGARYPLVQLACEQSIAWPLHAVTVASALASLASLWLGITVARRSRDTPTAADRSDEQPRVDDREPTRLVRMRFLGRAGVLTSAVFLTTILAEALPTFFYDPCHLMTSP